MNRTIMTVALAAAIVVSGLAVAGCSGKKEVEKGVIYKCKVCGRVYKEDVETVKLPKDVAETVGVEEVMGYCPKCGDEIIEFEQVQHQKCPICGEELGVVTTTIEIERRLSDDMPKETDVPVPCGKARCARAGVLHDKYNWDWETCAYVADGNISIGFTKDQVIEAWGQPNSVVTEGYMEILIYENNRVHIGTSKKVVNIED
jgi:DNA-directed RNA polymerase subunit RPC12/RpoP